MSALIVNKTYADPIPPTVEQLDAAFDSISTFFNVTGISSDNIEDNSLGANELAPNSVTSAKMSLNSVTANKIADGSVTVAKLVAEIQRGLEPVGTIGEYAGDDTPAGWLECNGIPINRQSYATLFEVIGVRFGAGDGTNTFNTPDLQGRFLRGVDGTAGRDPNSATRTSMNFGGAAGNLVGSVEDDSFVVENPNGVITSQSGGAVPYGLPSAGTVGTANPITVNGYIRSTTPSNRGLETRPQNAYVRYLIKF